MNVQPGPVLELTGVTAGYGRTTVLCGVDLTVPADRLTVIIGPNGCGKTTLLRIMSGLLKPRTGTVLVLGDPLRDLNRRKLARRVAVLGQMNEAPAGLDAVSLVARARYPHTTVWRQWSPADDEAVQSALATVGATDLAHRPLESLSGGQAQRIWLASLLAQQARIMLLDEPTTYLDVAAQQSVFELLATLVGAGHSVVASLHDLNQARLADHVVVMSRGRVAAQGLPGEVMDPRLLSDVYGTPLRWVADPLTNRPLIVGAPPG